MFSERIGIQRITENISLRQKRYIFFFFFCSMKIPEKDGCECKKNCKNSHWKIKNAPILYLLVSIFCEVGGSLAY